MELISRLIKSENRRRKLEHAQRVLRMIKSKYERDLGDPKMEVNRLRSIGRKFLNETLRANEAGLSPTKAQKIFWDNNDDYRNRHLPENFSNLKDLSNVCLRRCSIANLDLSRIRIIYNTGETFRPDLEKGACVYDAEKFFTTDTLGASVGNCYDCERWNKQILNDKSSYFGRGLVLKLGGVAIGYVKLKGERSLLCSRTVRDKNGKLLFVKGMVYSLDPKMEIFIKETLEVQGGWQSISLEDVQNDWFNDYERKHKLRFRHMRFVESKEIFDKLDWFNEQFGEQSRNES